MFFNTKAPTVLSSATTKNTKNTTKTTKTATYRHGHTVRTHISPLCTMKRQRTSRIITKPQKKSRFQRLSTISLHSETVFELFRDGKVTLRSACREVLQRLITEQLRLQEINSCGKSQLFISSCLSCSSLAETCKKITEKNSSDLPEISS